MGAVVIPVQSQEMKRSRARLLVRLIYVQAILLSAAYAFGVFLTFSGVGASIGTPNVIGHGIVASSFGVATALVALVAAIQGMKRVSVYNFVLFAFTLVGGVSGFAFLGHNSSFSIYEATNMLMTGVMAVGMPITGVSLALVSRAVRGGPGAEAGKRLPMGVTYAALGALALTLVAGTGISSTPFPSGMKTAHFVLSGLTLVLIAVLVLVNIREAVPRRLQTVVSFVTGMLFLQVLATSALWGLNPLSVSTTNAFALLLAANLIVFATVLHMYRGAKDYTSEPGSVPSGSNGSSTSDATGDSRFYMRSLVSFSLVSLLFIAVAVGAGAAFLYFGGITYIMGMADFAILVYVFLLLGIERP